ncbi:MAG TPA: uracil-DNA glycosylase [Steroidobacteraceae bacterium]|nr:uracil-DNA glycosylase [Steroidobacteraceae bacterium]
MSPAALAGFVRLITVKCTPDVFNPWTDRDPLYDGRLNGPAARRARLCAHLSVSAAQILIGEASGYQGGHISGIPFTSERLLMSGMVPRVSCAGRRLSARHIPWSEPSATVVWSTLQALGIAATTILWNAFPWHPHRAGNLQSNRTPTRAERTQGLAALAALLRASPGARLFAVGRHAQLALQTIGCDSASPDGASAGAVVLRHPSMGGASEFREGLRRALRGPAARGRAGCRR